MFFRIRGWPIQRENRLHASGAEQAWLYGFLHSRRKGINSLREGSRECGRGRAGTGNRSCRGGGCLPRGLPSVVAARMGSLVAARKVSVAGPHYCYSFDELCRDYETVYGETLTPEPAA